MCRWTPSTVSVPCLMALAKSELSANGGCAVRHLACKRKGQSSVLCSSFCDAQPHLLPSSLPPGSRSPLPHLLTDPQAALQARGLPLWALMLAELCPPARGSPGAAVRLHGAPRRPGPLSSTPLRRSQRARWGFSHSSQEEAEASIWCGLASL